MIWRDFEVAAPELASLGRERFERTSVALVGTLRGDGSPRISPVEPYLVIGHLLLGTMSRSGKAGDLLRDQRCSVHSSVADVNGSEGEFQLHGRAILVEDDEIRQGDYSAWWQSLPREACSLFSVDIDSAAFVDWDI
ncbi:MAG: pyridoxamine 5'-phosphate oxidase family protein, partial [Chloroflexota bacterium]|nr:pyridoxamine 5'-phosphate oxidase family protein [Chloroflexota bacterium]